MRGTPHRLYFAYGSNLSLAQMAKRCPASYYVGRAVLPDYRWQINQRGYANVVACPGSSVHGLVFQLGNDSDDEARLDRSEGVRIGAKTKANLRVVLYTAPDGLQLKTRRVVQEGLLWRPSREREWPPRFETDVLVYLSERFVRQGNPRDEYVDRMNTGVRDAVVLGVPEAYFDNAVRASVPRRPLPVVRRPTTPRAQSAGWRDRPRPEAAEEGGYPRGWGRDGRIRPWTPNLMGWRSPSYVREGQLEDRGSYLLYHVDGPNPGLDQGFR